MDFKKGIFLLASFFQSHVLLAQAKECTPSSTIPDKRSFPTNPHKDPCDNFYQYACSEALSCFKLREDRNRHIFAFSDSSERLLDQKKTFLKNLNSESSGWSRSLAHIYTACTNGEAGKNEEKSLVEKMLSEVKAFKTKDEFRNYMVDQNLAAKAILIDFGSLPNLEDADWSDLVLDPSPLMSLPERSYYHNPELMKAFEELVTAFFETLGSPHPEASKRAHAIAEFEKGLADVFPLPHEIRKLETEKRYITRKKLLLTLSKLRVDKILKPIPQRVVFRDLFPKALTYVNKKFTYLPLETLKDIFLYKALSAHMDDAYPEYFNKKFAFQHTYLGGPSKRPERDERCAMSVMSSFSKELDKEVIEKLFPDFPTEKFEQLVEKIRVSMVNRVEKNTWLSVKGREGALKKLRAIKMRLVKPKNDKEWDLQLLGDYKADTRIANSFERIRLGREKMIKELASKRNREAWEMNPLLVNAYYDPSNNTFNMPQGILQYPFFDGSLNEYENFGAVGVVVGHEIGHAFDDNGAKYNEKGVLEDWMSPQDIKTFQKLGSVLVDQYNNAGHNGQLTLGENIADTTGLNFSYAAAFPNGEGSKEAKQAFFLQYARVWCGTMTDSEYQRRLKTDPHAQTEVRVNEPIKHQNGFYEAFSCKVGDKMFLAPDKRLQLW